MQKEIQHFPFHAMGSACEIVIASPHAADELAQTAIDEVRRIEYKYSRYRSDSIVSQINAAAGKHAIACDEETWNLLEYANSLFELSSGLFDITAGVLRRAWNFKEARLPEPQQLNQLCELINWSSCERDQGRLYLPQAGMEIDFGGFGKEYAADRAAMVLAEQGVHNAYVNLGGDIHIVGPKLDGNAWNIGIQDPRQKEAVIASIPLRDGGLATSGDYEKYVEINGERYCHLLNPKTGMPARHWMSISVIAPNCLMAGSYSTIAMLSEHGALEFLNDADVSYFAVDKNMKITMQK